jgi:hypothetical protein
MRYQAPAALSSILSLSYWMGWGVSVGGWLLGAREESSLNFIRSSSYYGKTQELYVELERLITKNENLALENNKRKRKKEIEVKSRKGDELG